MQICLKRYATQEPENDKENGSVETKLTKLYMYRNKGALKSLICLSAASAWNKII